MIQYAMLPYHTTIQIQHTVQLVWYHNNYSKSQRTSTNKRKRSFYVLQNYWNLVDIISRLEHTYVHIMVWYHTTIQ